MLHRLLVLLFILCFASSNANAQETTSGKQQFKGDNALIHADVLTYNPQENMVMATGNVEIAQDGRILVADQLTYNKQTGVVIAEGDISILEPDGTVYFAKKVKLKDDLKQGVINSFGARFFDDSLLAANSAVRKNEDITTMQQAVYSPCRVCEGDPDSAPLWQISADEVEVNMKEEKVTYDDAFFELYGLPVLYTPYLSHATPGAKKKSGFLVPSYSTINTLGTTVKVPYYWNIAPNMDATFAPIYTSSEGPVLSGEFRHKVKSGGKYELMGSITNPDKRDGAGNKTGGNEIRGHIEGFGEFEIDDHWSWGFDAKRSSDDTYLQRYKFGSEDLLTSKAYIEQIKNDDYISIEAISFQGLNSEDDPGTTPLILPYVNSHLQTDPGWRNSVWSLDSNLLALSRSEGIESRRVSSKAQWELPVITPGGHVFSFKASVRGDAYDVENVADPNNPARDQEGFAGRVIPEAELDWSFPLVKQNSSSSLLIEPVVQMIISPYGNNPNKIPNEDSQEIEISDMNLFSSNHFTGLDLVEGGPRANYGVRGLYSIEDLTDINFLFGQNYRVKEQEEFTPESGLDDNLSDYVGRVGFTIFDNMADVNYRFRLDREDLNSRRSEVDSNFNLDPFQIGVSYLLLNEGTEQNPILDREEIQASGKVQLTEFWALQGNTRRDLSDGGGFINSGAGLVYENECLTLSMLFDRDFTSDRDIEPSESFTFQIVLKNLN